MDINIQVTDKQDIVDKQKIDSIFVQKLLFLYNALENGWELKKHNEKYIFTKLHEGKKEIFHDSYLHQFLENNLNQKIYS